MVLKADLSGHSECVCWKQRVEQENRAIREQLFEEYGRSGGSFGRSAYLPTAGAVSWRTAAEFGDGCPLPSRPRSVAAPSFRTPTGSGGSRRSRRTLSTAASSVLLRREVEHAVQREVERVLNASS
mmetsp:Transcript_81828/g.227921  ORF Transcript_81828/g.227921 Transcript_81828/m.227921 type:complete len:126 (-) Transcript_81828:171-548(-)